MALDKFQALPASERALVAIAVLLDGREAGTYLQGSDPDARRTKEVAEELARIAPELRMPLLGTLLRTALRELKDDKRGGA